MRLEDLKVIQNITPYWGQGHYLAQTPEGELIEVLVAERSSESVTSLLSWANALERIDHPTIPRVKTIAHKQTTFVALQQREGLPLSHCIHQHHDLLSRLDILMLFYQLATALRQLHDHGLNHANLTLDQMRVVGEGKLLLQGWAPPSIDQYFASRCLDDLKRFKNFFYLTLVGDFPPQRLMMHEEDAEHISPLERQRLGAWRRWYQAESSLPQPNLSRSALLLFSETPKSAQAIVEELAPYLDTSLSQFYQGLHQEFTRRESFEVLCQQREHLLNELERIHHITQMWLKQHEPDRLLGDRHCHVLERLYDQARSSHEQLEILGEKTFFGAKQSLDELSPHMSLSSNTLLYEQFDLRPSADDVKGTKTFGGALSILDSQWSQVDPHQPISIPSKEVSHLMSPSMSRGADEPHSHQYLASHLASLIERAQLPPLRLDDDSPQAQMSGARLSSAPFSPLSSLMNEAQEPSEIVHSLSELGIEPLSTAEELRQVSLQSGPDPQSTQIFQHGALSPSQGANPTFSGFIPDSTFTGFTQHYQAIYNTESQQTNENTPHIALSPRNFFVFLYVATILIFGWSVSLELFPQWHESASTHKRSIPDTYIANPKPPLAGAVSPKAPKRESRPAPPVLLPPQRTRPHGLTTPEDTVAPEPSKETSHREQIPHKGHQTPPEGMAYIPGGITYSGLGEKAYQTAVSYCVFEPKYGKQRRSRDQCKRLIPAEQKMIKAFSVKPFFMDIYEVTRGEYLEYCRTGGVCKSRVRVTEDELDLPMVQLSMLEAHDYCHRQNKTLPTRQQWLAAARGDQQLIYPWGNQPVRQGHRSYRANYLSSKRKIKRGKGIQEIDGHIGPHAVTLNAELGMSRFGVAHLLGNVSEWVMNNRFKEGLVVGGSWRTPIWNLRITSGELHHKYEHRSDDLGFRCVREVSKNR